MAAMMREAGGGILLAVDRLDRGGLERAVATLALGIHRRGQPVVVLCWREGGNTARELSRAGVRVHIARGRRAVLERVLEREPPRVLGSHWADLEVLEAATAHGLPVVEHIHNSYIWLDEAGWARERARSGHFARALAVSDFTRRYYSRWNPGLDSTRLAVLGNGVPPRESSLAAHAAARARLGINSDDFLILSLGGYDGIKNQLGLLTTFEDVARRHPQMRLMCAGEVTNREYFETVRRVARQSEYKRRIVVSTYQRDAAAWLEAADLYVVDSFAEGWSLAATEALMTGVPLVHSECGGANELVGDGARGVCVANPAGDPLALDRGTFMRMMWERDQPNRGVLGEAIQQMIETRRVWQARRTEIARQAHETFGEETMVEGYLIAVRETAGTVS
jgi:glycosyltransferase involved in cell wall biosynthesis